MLKNTVRLNYLCGSFNSLVIKNKLQAGKIYRTSTFFSQHVREKKDDASNISTLFVPVPVKSNLDDINVGAELTGTLKKSDLLKVISKLYQKKEIKTLLADNGLDRKLF